MVLNEGPWRGRGIFRGMVFIDLYIYMNRIWRPYLFGSGVVVAPLSRFSARSAASVLRHWVHRIVAGDTPGQNWFRSWQSWQAASSVGETWDGERLLLGCLSNFCPRHVGVLLCDRTLRTRWRCLTLLLTCGLRQQVCFICCHSHTEARGGARLSAKINVDRQQKFV